ncbi:BrnA antitoxin family protein [Pseudochelatococcus sp. B33]
MIGWWEPVGEMRSNPDAPIGESLGAEFWAMATIVEPKTPKPVLLKLDPDVSAFFKAQGKGHIRGMQNLLKAYADARRTRTHNGPQGIEGQQRGLEP